MEISIQRLGPRNARDYRQLRLRALKESPTAYGSTYARTAQRPLKDFADFLEVRPDNWNFGAFDGKRLIGTVRLVRYDGSKEQHKASIHGLYVVSAQRRKGLGRLLLTKACETARGWRGLRQINLGVVATNTAAIALYRGLGFLEYGREEDALYVGRTFYPEILMVLTL